MNEKAIAAALEPLADELVALEKRFEQIQLVPGPQGEPGRDADATLVAATLACDSAFVARCKAQDGKDGNDGAGIYAPYWIRGEVYREGFTVVAHIGQHFIALKDTAEAPGDSDHWRRIGKGGFRYRGNFDKDAAYTDGDFYIKDFGTFCIVNGEPVLFGARGTQGKQGATGMQGARGRDGRDGSTIIAAQAEGFKLVLVQQCGDGAVDHLEADFTPAYHELVREALAEMRAEIAELKNSIRESTL